MLSINGGYFVNKPLPVGSDTRCHGEPSGWQLPVNKQARLPSITEHHITVKTAAPLSATIVPFEPRMTAVTPLRYTSDVHRLVAESAGRTRRRA